MKSHWFINLVRPLRWILFLESAFLANLEGSIFKIFSFSRYSSYFTFLFFLQISYFAGVMPALRNLVNLLLWEIYALFTIYILNSRINSVKKYVCVVEYLNSMYHYYDTVWIDRFACDLITRKLILNENYFFILCRLISRCWCRFSDVVQRLWWIISQTLLGKLDLYPNI